MGRFAAGSSQKAAFPDALAGALDRVRSPKTPTPASRAHKKGKWHHRKREIDATWTGRSGRFAVGKHSTISHPAKSGGPKF